MQMDFTCETFINDHQKVSPEAYLPKNLSVFWIDAILDAHLSLDASRKSISSAIITFACSALVQELGEELDELHLELFLQELILEKLERINIKAGVTNSGFVYFPAELDEIFTGPHYSAEHMVTLLKLVAGAIEWEKRWSEKPLQDCPGIAGFAGA
jgi:hypothetical protein